MQQNFYIALLANCPHFLDSRAIVWYHYIKEIQIPFYLSKGS